MHSNPVTYDPDHRPHFQSSPFFPVILDAKEKIDYSYGIQKHVKEVFHYDV